jgi:hypothetical protein
MEDIKLAFEEYLKTRKEKELPQFVKDMYTWIKFSYRFVLQTSCTFDDINNKKSIFFIILN